MGRVLDQCQASDDIAVRERKLRRERNVVFQAVGVDLRFKNQVIIRMKEDDTRENIIWDAEKKTL